MKRTVHFRTPYFGIAHPQVLTIADVKRLTDVDLAIYSCIPRGIRFARTLYVRLWIPVHSSSREFRVSIFNTGFFLDGGSNGKGRAHS